MLTYVAKRLLQAVFDDLQDVTEGQRLGVVRDYFGSTLQIVEAPADAKVMSMSVGMPVKKDGYLLWLGEV